MNALIKQQTLNDTFQVEPVLRKAWIEAEEEHGRLQQMFGLMGWGDIPDALKMEIKEDVSSMIDELEGRYSSCDPYVARRRKSVTYWVDAYREGICSLDTAVQALRVKGI